MSLATLLAENKHLSLTEANRIKCSYSGHEMPARADVVQQYLNSKKFQKMKEWYSQDYSKYAPYVVQDKNDPKKLFCTLTHMQLNKIPEEVEKHINGKKFLRLKSEAELKIKKKSRSNSDDSDTPDIWIPSDEILNEDEDKDEAVEEGDEDNDYSDEEFIVRDDNKSKGKKKRKAVEAPTEDESDIDENPIVQSKGIKSKAKLRRSSAVA